MRTIDSLPLMEARTMSPAMKREWVILHLSKGISTNYWFMGISLVGVWSDEVPYPSLRRRVGLSLSMKLAACCAVNRRKTSLSSLTDINGIAQLGS